MTYELNFIDETGKPTQFGEILLNWWESLDHYTTQYKTLPQVYAHFTAYEDLQERLEEAVLEEGDDPKDLNQDHRLVVIAGLIAMVRANDSEKTFAGQMGTYLGALGIHGNDGRWLRMVNSRSPQEMYTHLYPIVRGLRNEEVNILDFAQGVFNWFDGPRRSEEVARLWADRFYDSMLAETEE